MATTGTPGLDRTTARKSIKKTPEKTRVTQQASSPVGAAPAEGETSSESEDEGEADPMVSKPVKPFLIPVVLIAG